MYNANLAAVQWNVCLLQTLKNIPRMVLGRGINTRRSWCIWSFVVIWNNIFKRNGANFQGFVTWKMLWHFLDFVAKTCRTSFNYPLFLNTTPALVQCFMFTGVFVFHHVYKVAIIWQNAGLMLIIRHLSASPGQTSCRTCVAYQEFRDELRRFFPPGIGSTSRACCGN